MGSMWEEIWERRVLDEVWGGVEEEVRESGMITA